MSRCSRKQFDPGRSERQGQHCEMLRRLQRVCTVITTASQPLIRPKIGGEPPKSRHQSIVPNRFAGTSNHFQAGTGETCAPGASSSRLAGISMRPADSVSHDCGERIRCAIRTMRRNRGVCGITYVLHGLWGKYRPLGHSVEDSLSNNAQPTGTVTASGSGSRMMISVPFSGGGSKSAWQ